MSSIFSVPASFEAKGRDSCSATMHESIDGQEACTRCRSRSTSAGSRTPQLHDDEDMTFVVRNTFIENVASRPASLEGFFHKREIHSCPVSRHTSDDEIPVGLEAFLESLNHSLEILPETLAVDNRVGRPLSLDDFFFEQRDSRACPVSWGSPSATITFPPILKKLLSGIEEGPSESVCSPVDSPRCAKGEVAYAPMKTASSLGFPVMQPPRTMEEYPVLHRGVETLPPLVTASVPEACVVRLADALPESTLGFSAAPTVGSIGHYVGECKPCAFLYTRGCINGVHCPFCHLCSPGEKKRRKQGKKELRRQTRTGRVVHDGTGYPLPCMSC